jgi:hypothetical protein
MTPAGRETRTALEARSVGVPRIALRDAVKHAQGSSFPRGGGTYYKSEESEDDRDAQLFVPLRARSTKARVEGTQVHRLM